MFEDYILANKSGNKFYAVDSSGYPYQSDWFDQTVFFKSEKDATECLLDIKTSAEKFLKDYSVFKIVLQPIDNQNQDDTFLKKPVKSSNIRKVIDKDKKGKTQLISIRLPINLIENLKTIGKIEKLGYQTLSRNILQRFVENRNQFIKLISENRKLEKEIEEMRLEIKRLK
ncbi:MAG: hypothetical protein [Bacteriophage sp.]|nr:MAG: hypothetical protein [Bacteriophage sp.]